MGWITPLSLLSARSNSLNFNPLQAAGTIIPIEASLLTGFVLYSLPLVLNMVGSMKAENKEQLNELSTKIDKSEGKLEGKIDKLEGKIDAVLAAVNAWKTQAGEWRVQDQATMFKAVSDSETRTNAKINALRDTILNASLLAPRVPSANIPPAAGSDPPTPS